jgi:hypothetical protein
MLSLLSVKGGQETFNYLHKKLYVDDVKISSIVKICLKKLSENTKDLKLKEKIDSLLSTQK